MVRHVSATIAVCLALALGGCKNDAESAMSDAVSKMNELAGVLKGVTDKASADAALPKVKALSADLQGLMAKVDGFKGSEAETKATEKYAMQMFAALMAVGAEGERAGNLSPAIKAALAGVAK